MGKKFIRPKNRPFRKFNRDEEYLEQIGKEIPKKISFGKWRHKWFKENGLKNERSDYLIKQQKKLYFYDWTSQFEKYKYLNYWEKREYYRKVYLKSEHWNILKSEKLKQVCYCEECKSKNKLDVHHLEYRNLYDVQLTDLKVLCRKCHHKEHKKDKK